MNEGSNHPDSDHDLIVRMDERVKQAVTMMEQRDIYHRSEMDRMGKMMMEVIGSFTGTIVSMQAGFASKADIATTNTNVSRLERTVYGACALVLMAFIAALVAVVFRNGGIH